MGVLWAVIDVLLVIVFAIGLIYGLLMYRRRPHDPALGREREATDHLYHHEEAAAEAATEGRPHDTRPVRPKTAVAADHWSGAASG